MVDSILRAIKDNAVKTPGKICLRDFKGEISYSDYFELIEKNATYFVSKGIKSGDYVVIRAEQTVDYLAAFHAVQLAGGIPVPLEKNVKSERVREVCTLVKAKLSVDAQSEAENVTYDDIRKNKKFAHGFTLPSCEDVAEVLFTTGTTGKSKGVVMTHGADVAVAENVIYGVEMKKDNTEVIPMPLNHSFALRRYYANMLNGSTAILLDGVVFVDRFFECFDKYGAVSAALAPAALSIILKLSGDKLKDYDGKIDYFQMGSAHLGEKEKNTLLSLLPSARLYNFYGSSEAGCSCILNFNSEDNLPYCIGRPTKNSKIIFVGDDGTSVFTDRDNPARLTTGGKMLMKEYFCDRELTNETLIAGAVFSNDSGYTDEDGRVFMLGRSDDVIISGGNKISPAEVESVCLQYEGIEECALTGRKDNVAGEIPVLYAVVTEAYSEEKFMEFLAGRLERFMLPKIIRKVKELPKSFNGKILRKELKKTEGGIS